MSSIGTIEIELDLRCGECGGSLEYIDVGGCELRVQSCLDCYVLRSNVGSVDDPAEE